jgi:hypothetical protein
MSEIESPVCDLLSEIADRAASKLKPRLISTAHWEGGELEIKKIAYAPRGSSCYAGLTRSRIDGVISPMIELLEAGETVIKLDLTAPYDKTVEGIESSWLKRKEILPCFIRWMKGKGFDNYIYSTEAHLSGGAHVHLIIHSQQPPPKAVA